MNDKRPWPPGNVPNVKRDFEGKPAEKISVPCPIATKTDLDRLIAERNNPVRNLDYLPNSQVTSKLQDETRQQREDEITALQKIFAKYQNNARDDFNRNADDYSIKCGGEGYD